ncbi:methionine adenosyltransferase [Anaplasma phagocytophilum]|uniref:Methionine adenosyltransferase n=1 Tax=Anaplasma phagocytophilum str. ApNP TaxID=1359153 RepID=A0A0F3NHU2_ANAPH|nr:methionine adenosyltransferase [Anaplasma phagocytophilum str. ApNP]
MFHLDRYYNSYFITSESVAHGHPDKVADRISDDILDYFMSINPEAHVAVEALVTRDNVIIAGEVSGVIVEEEEVDGVVRKTLREIGYEKEGFHWREVKVRIMLQEQSHDIMLGVNRGRKKKGAGDQGVMYGYAINETESYMPSPIFYSHRVLKNLSDAVKQGSITGIGPDAKTEITLQYVDHKPVKVLRAVLSVQHDESRTQQDVRDLVYPYFVSSIPEGWMCKEENFLVNPTGRFVVGGPVGDTGITGRKIMVDTYGGHIPHGGGAFSGKDPSKVDRSAAYMARYIAKNVVHAGLASECLVQMSYAIGVPAPLTFAINTFGTSVVDVKEIERCILSNIDLSVSGICEKLSLYEQIYSPTSCYGHFGRTHENSFSWEKLDLSLILNREFSCS